MPRGRQVPLVIQRRNLISAKIAVVYYSATGNVHALATALAEGATKAGAEVRLRRVTETAPDGAVQSNPAWKAHAEDVAPGVELASLDDLEWANGIALGTPTRFGLPTAQLKSFIDTTGGLWFQGKVADKVGTSFTAASTQHGGVESTLLAINNTFYHWGSLVLPLGYGQEHLMKRSGNPYGASYIGTSGPGEDDLIAAGMQGERLAKFAALVAGS